MKKQNSNRSKRIVKTEKGYAGDLGSYSETSRARKFIYCSKRNWSTK
ncbi:hypothetical protein ACT7DA_07445 [Bacillus pacificus]